MSRPIIQDRIRWYQAPLYTAMTQGPQDRYIEIAHRRWGKDEIFLKAVRECANNPTCPKYRVGNYWHCLPEYAQGRKAIWDSVNAHTGKRRLDEAFPMSLRKRTDNTTMFIEFHTGATYQVIGSDRYDSTVGAGPVGLGYSEWALANPSAWGYHRPMVEENKGWAAFITTPRGNNHAKAMYEMALKSDRWYAEVSDARMTGVLTEAQLQESLDEYQSIYGDDFGLAYFEQEYLCSFSGAMVGAYFGAEMNRAEREGRITTVEINPKYPVHSAWDLGKAQNNPIWFFQVIGTQLRVVDYYKPDSDDLEEWCAWMDARGYHGTDYVPHDAVTGLQWGTKRTRIEMMRALKRNPKVIPIAPFMDGINAGNVSIRAAVFDAEKCAAGLDGLRNYRREWDDERKTFRENAFKDWAEHIGSSWRYLALSWRNEVIEKPKPEKPKALEYIATPTGVIMGNMSVKDAVDAMVRRRKADG